jgi:hypothetical protein
VSLIFCLSVGDSSPLTIRWRHRVRVVKELVLKANGLCPREFKSRRCRPFVFALGQLEVRNG